MEGYDDLMQDIEKKSEYLDRVKSLLTEINEKEELANELDYAMNLNGVRLTFFWSLEEGQADTAIQLLEEYSNSDDAETIREKAKEIANFLRNL